MVGGAGVAAGNLPFQVLHVGYWKRFRILVPAGPGAETRTKGGDCRSCGCFERTTEGVSC